MAHKLISRKTSLSENILSFCRFLRQKGFTVGPLEVTDALLALNLTAAFDSADDFRNCLRAVLAKNRTQAIRFDELFFQYWKELQKAVDSKVADQATSKARKKKNTTSFERLKKWLQGQGDEKIKETAYYSPQESIGKKDFAHFAEEEMEELDQLIRKIARSLALRYSRRMERSRKQRRLDLRKTLRLNLRRGGEILHLAHRRHKRRKHKIVLLCDVSKSMDLYSKILIRFTYAFQQVYRRIETFIFGTRLHRVTSHLRKKEFEEALDEMSDENYGWSGGTRIGASLKEFCDLYGSRLLTPQTVVIIMSDGWDVGDVDLLVESMATIQKKSARVIWLNPLAGSRTYQPTTTAMKAALPHIDVFAPAHNLSSLKKLIELL